MVAGAGSKGGEFVIQIGKRPIMVNRKAAGCVISRTNRPSNIEAKRLIEESIATPEDIDKGLRLASGRKAAIFETGDMVGLDDTNGSMMACYKETPHFYRFHCFAGRSKPAHIQ
jgi:3-hydroxybutyryl-CoA dehydrogenase